MAPKTWQTQLQKIRTDAGASQGYLNANLEAIRGTLDGRGPDNPQVKPKAGARIVFNIPNIYLLSFVLAGLARAPKPYKNAYDVGTCRIGKDAHDQSLRESVDSLLLPLKKEDGTDAKESDIYFGAVELNGAGVRFYGDYCLVLKSEFGPPTTILDRNSYDFMRAPLKDDLVTGKEDKLSFKGTWKNDLADIAAVKVLEGNLRQRRLTSGTISEALIQDEDYIEVLKIHSFSPNDLQEVRTSASDAAHEALLAQRVVKGPTPQFSALIWSLRRRRAEEALKYAKVQVRVVTTSGRIKS